MPAAWSGWSPSRRRLSKEETIAQIRLRGNEPAQSEVPVAVLDTAIYDFLRLRRNRPQNVDARIKSGQGEFEVVAALVSDDSPARSAQTTG